MLLALLRGTPPSSVLWSAFLVWKDFGIARDDRREVPLEERARSSSPAVAIIEQFCGWEGAAGAFVAAAIAARFFTLTPITDNVAELVLVDFFPANHSGARDITNSKLGGIAKGVNSARKGAERSTREQLDMFAKSSHPLLAEHGRAELRTALLFIHQVCNVLHRQKPASAEWQASLTVKALDILNHHNPAAVEAAFKWLIANRESQEIGDRLDFILDRFPEFIKKGQLDFR
jgi:hypothetical protein